MTAEEGLMGKVASIRDSLTYVVPEMILFGSILIILLGGLIVKSHTSKEKIDWSILAVGITFLLAAIFTNALLLSQVHSSVALFDGMLRYDRFSAYFNLLFDVGGVLTLIMSFQRNSMPRSAEYVSLVLAIVLGAHLLVMSTNFVMIFLSLETISIGSYILAGFAFSKQAAEGSLKYFLFGATASAVMLYGFSILYGLTGTLDFSSAEFLRSLVSPSSLLMISGLMSLTGFLYKVAAVPMHPWAPDVYEASPMPVVAFFSVVPKLAGVGILTRFVFALNGASHYDWQFIVAVVAIATISVGNLSALWQKSPKRLMAYSSIAQSGFLLVGLAAFIPEGIHFMLFYATAYLVMNFVVFIYLQFFENRNILSISDFAGQGRLYTWPLIALLVAFVSLTGLPPTGGFMAKFFVFSSLWNAYQATGKSILLALFIIGLLNTVVSLFYYLRIPYYAFLRPGWNVGSVNSFTIKNFFGLILVLAVLLLFFQPNLLMSWINRINFVL